MKQLSYKNITQKELLKKLDELKVEIGKATFMSKDPSIKSELRSSKNLKKDVARINTVLRENF